MNKFSQDALEAACIHLGGEPGKPFETVASIRLAKTLDAFAAARAAEYANVEFNIAATAALIQKARLSGYSDAIGKLREAPLGYATPTKMREHWAHWIDTHRPDDLSGV